MRVAIVYRLTPEQQTLVLQWMDYAKFAAGKMYKSRYMPAKLLDWEDLVSICQKGLVYAAARFDPSKGISFGTYCTYWIRYAVQEEAQFATTVCLPRRYYETQGALKTTRQARSVFSTHGLPYENNEDGEDAPITAPEVDLDHQIDTHDLAECVMSGLNAREKYVLREYFSGYSMGEIARREGKSSQSIQQVYAKAMKKARKILGVSPT